MNTGNCKNIYTFFRDGDAGGSFGASISGGKPAVSDFISPSTRGVGLMEVPSISSEPERWREGCKIDFAMHGYEIREIACMPIKTYIDEKISKQKRD